MALSYVIDIVIIQIELFSLAVVFILITFQTLVYASDPGVAFFVALAHENVFAFNLISIRKIRPSVSLINTIQLPLMSLCGAFRRE